MSPTGPNDPETAYPAPGDPEIYLNGDTVALYVTATDDAASAQVYADDGGMAILEAATGGDSPASINATAANGAAVFKVAGDGPIGVLARADADKTTLELTPIPGQTSSDPTLTVYDVAAGSAVRVYPDGHVELLKDIVVSGTGKGLALKAPNGGLWRLKVDNSGALSTEVWS